MSGVRLGDEAGRVLEIGLRGLKDDHESGARALATRAVRVLRDTVEKIEPSKGWQKRVKMAGWHLCRNGREAMGAAVGAAVVDALGWLSTILGTEFEVCDPIETMVEILGSWLEERERSAGKLGDAFAEFVKGGGLAKAPSLASGKEAIEILTISNSSALRGCLIRALEAHPTINFDLRIVESRPLCEGVTMARLLIRSASEKGLLDRLRITLASDSSVAMLARHVDAVLLGADRISANGDVSNKMGSLAAVLCAKTVSPEAKVVVVCESEKIAKPGGMEELKDEENDVRELMEGWKMNENINKMGKTWEVAVEVKNVYFEWVPSQYIDAIIVENGQIKKEEIKSRSKRVAQVEEMIFRDL